MDNNINSYPYQNITRIAQPDRFDSRQISQYSMPKTSSTTRSKSKIQKPNTAPATPVGSRTGTDGSSVQIPIWASTAKIDQLEDLCIDSSDDEQNDDQVVEKKDDSNKMVDESTPGAPPSSSASPLIVRDGQVEEIAPKVLSFSSTSPVGKSSPDRPAGQVQDAPVAPEAALAAREAAVNSHGAPVAPVAPVAVKNDTVGAKSATSGQAGLQSFAVPTGQCSVALGDTCWVKWLDHSHRVVIEQLNAAAGSDDDPSCVVRFDDQTKKTVGIDCVRTLEEGVFPGYPEFGNPSNSVPLVAPSSAKFLLGERIARAEEMMEESPHHDMTMS
eukprot:SAG11_NODE_48_length_20030_cov_232.459084_15_plen_329_part_00